MVQLEPFGLGLVSKFQMRKLWFILLPLIHLILASAWISHEAAMLWPYLPRLQQEEDFEREHPPVASMSEVGWDDSEYRPSYQAVGLITIDPVPALLALARFPFRFASGNSIHGPVLAAVMHPLTDRLRLKTRILVLDGLFLSLVGVQWFLIGRWLDSKASPNKPRFLIFQPPLLISGLALSAQLLILIQGLDHSNSLGYTPELIARLCLSVALLIWILWGAGLLWQFALRLRNRLHLDKIKHPSA